jgi:ABC-type nitrate/sulfonate/bicarbonate transport system substrate-binding protein
MLGDLLVTAPLQRGCLALSVPVGSDVQSVADLRGLKVAGSKFVYGKAVAEAGVDPNTEIDWSPAPVAADVLTTLEIGEFAAVQSPDGQGALLEVVGLARMIAMNNMPPSKINYCCASVLNASAVQGDRNRAAPLPVR